MESRAMKIKSDQNKKMSITVIPGHFATNHSHINYYIDMTSIKHRLEMAREAAIAMTSYYANTTLIDTIVVMDGCEMIGAFLAEELAQAGMVSMNSKSDIFVVTPEFNSSGQMIFRDNLQKMVWNKNVLLLIASATTGKTIKRSLECIHYYGGKIVGVCAIFSAISELEGLKVNSLFTSDDLPNYATYAAKDCPDCKEQKKIDAIVNSYGYSKL